MKEVIDFFKVEMKNGGLRFIIKDFMMFLTSSPRKELDEILRIAKKHNCKFTFFVVGRVCDSDPELVKKIAEGGHEIASHAYNHVDYSKLTGKEIEEDLRKSIASLKKLGIKARGFRPPYLLFKKNIYSISKKVGFSYVSGLEKKGQPFKINSIYEAPISPPFDWELIGIKGEKDRKKIMHTWKKQAEAGGVLLFHPWIAGRLFKKEFEELVSFKTPIKIESLINKKKGYSISIDVGGAGVFSIIKRLIK